MSGLDGILASVSAEIERRDSGPFARYFPDCTPACADSESPEVADHAAMCRALYPKHQRFFAAGREFRERLFIAGNRVGKTAAGSFEVTAHLTGQYPRWWPGHRFDEPVSAWVSGNTGKTVRDIVQEKLLGPLREMGTGFIPKHLIEHHTRKQGIAEAVDTVWVRHVARRHGAPMTSKLTLKSYDQRRESFEGTAQHVIWLDEEPPEDIYDECLLRTMRTSDFPGGVLLMTFTPLMGLTPVVLRFLPGGKAPEAPVE